MLLFIFCFYLGSQYLKPSYIPLVARMLTPRGFTVRLYTTEGAALSRPTDTFPAHACHTENTGTQRQDLSCSCCSSLHWLIDGGVTAPCRRA